MFELANCSQKIGEWLLLVVASWCLGILVLGESQALGGSSMGGQAFFWGGGCQAVWTRVGKAGREGVQIGKLRRVNGGNGGRGWAGELDKGGFACWGGDCGVQIFKIKNQPCMKLSVQNGFCE